MKLHVNGKMAEREKERKRDREIDRKKKEQESAEAISGLKIYVPFLKEIQILVHFLGQYF